MRLVLSIIRTSGLLVTLVSSMVFSTGISGHHSFAMFDHENQLQLSGTVTRFQWTNPHVYIHLDVDNDEGGFDTWTIECANPGILSRIGWKFNSIKEGDEISIIVGPLHTGEPGALLKQVKFADGTIMSNGVPAGRPNIPLE
jgi:hypothetical protein